MASARKLDWNTVWRNGTLLIERWGHLALEDEAILLIELMKSADLAIEHGQIRNFALAIDGIQTISEQIVLRNMLRSGWNAPRDN